MMHILLFAGTADGRLLAERLAELPVRATICVATEYGGETLEDMTGRFCIRVGRLDAAAMRSLMAETDCRLVVDATHPYAVAVSANIREAAGRAGVQCLRLQRRESQQAACVRVESVAEAAKAIASMPGNVLLTTGAKELAEYTVVEGYAERMYPRVLPTEESLRECARLGFRRGHVIAMQGPFGRELNLALMRRYDIAVMVTKDGGTEGGFADKMSAAEEAGVRVVVVGRPDGEGGLTLDEILARVRRELEAES